MSTLVVLTAKAKSENVDAVKALFKEIIPDTRSYDGCREITVYQNMDSGGTFVAVENWESRPHYEKYLAWRTESGVLDKFVEMLEEAPDIQYYDAIDA